MRGRRRTASPGPLVVQAWGTVLVLVGGVLPFLRGPSPLWAWDLSVFWPVTGDLGAVHLPPSLGAVFLAAGALLAVPILRGRPIRGPVVAGVAGVVLGVTGLSVLRALTFPQAVLPLPGAILTLAGGVLVAAGALLSGDA